MFRGFEFNKMVSLPLGYYGICCLGQQIVRWDVNQCLKTYGHKNDKNFVGLTVNGNHIVCGE